MDYLYQEGATADCGLDFCCRVESETGQGSIKAGKFGSSHQRCDVPPATVESVLDRIVEHNPDFIFWSGDNTAHDNPFITQDEVNAELKAVVDIVSKKLGDRDLTITMGNHDAFPNSEWDFKTIGPSYPGREAFKRWVPKSEWSTWDQHAYYAKDLADLKTRVLSLNTESCDEHNLQLWNQLYDPNDQLKWLSDHLKELEEMDWKAILVGHIPHECSHEYTERFRAILDRYQKTVRFSMYGHEHSDVYKQVGSIEDPADPIGVLQVCGAITTWIGNNPAYCIYEVDKETMLPVSRKTYWFDITEANETGEPNW